MLYKPPFRFLVFFYSLLVVSFLLLTFTRADATHLMGGNLSYQYLGQVNPSTFRYKIILTTYQNCNSPFWNNGFPEPSVDLGVYEGAANQSTGLPTANLVLKLTVTLPMTDSVTIKVNMPNNCTVGTTVCVNQTTYATTVDLPMTVSGYHLYYDRCCRNNEVKNLINPGNQGMAFHSWIPASFVNNSSPVFSDTLVPFICKGDTTTILNTAVDPNSGDQMIFSFQKPFNGKSFGPPAPDPLIVPFEEVYYDSANGYSVTKPFGPNGYSYINASTGFTAYYLPDTSQFVVTVLIKEYRNNVLVGVSRRDVQLMVVDCPANPAPNLSSAGGSGQTSYTIKEGENLCFPIIYYDQQGDTLTLTSLGEVFDPSLVNPVATLPGVKADSLVSTQFCWNTACNTDRAMPYVFSVKVTDNGCPPKTTNTTYSITINKFTGPSSINGFDTVCSSSAGVSYNVTGSTGSTFSWSITGGTKASGGSTNSITVNWGTGTSGVVKVLETSADGCPADTVTKNIVINPLPVLASGKDTSFCSGKSVMIGPDSTAGYSYSWNPVTGLSNSLQSKPTLTLTNLTGIPVSENYIVTATLKGCAVKDTINVIVNPLPVSNAGADVNMCSGETGALGTASTANYTYTWLPVTGLNNAAISNPTITLTNVTVNPDTFQYIVTTTNTITTCLSFDTVNVIVRPLPISNAGPDVNFCSGNGVVIGAASTGGYTYSWSPVSGLSSSTLSNPTLSLTNSDTIHDTLNYTVTTTLNSCVTKDTVRIIVKSLPIANAGPDTSFCSQGSVILGTTSKTNYIYSWSPSTGLNNAAISNPTITLTDTSGVPDTVFYIVTTSDTITTCVSKDTVKIIVRPYPIPNAGSDVDFCSKDTATLGSLSTPGYTYAWTPITGLSSSVISDPKITLTNADSIPDTLNYIVTATIYSCSKNDTARVIVRPLPVSNAGPDVVFCSEESVTIGTASTSGYTYVWSPSNGLSDPTGANPNLTLINTNTNPGIINYVVTTTLSGCITKDTVRVTTNPLPTTSSIKGSNSICPGAQGVPYWVYGDSGSVFSWIIQGGTGGTIASGQGNDTILVNWDTTTVAQIKVLETDTNNCVGDTISLSVTVNVLLEPPKPNGEDTICDRYKDSVNYFAFPAPGSVYNWQIQGGVILSGNTTNSVIVNWNGVGNGMIWYQESSTTLDTVCDGTSDTLLVTIFKSPVATTLYGDFEVCEDTALISYFIDGLSNSNFIWFIDSDTLIQGINIDSVAIVWDSNGVYNVKVIEITQNNCIESLSDSVTVFKTPKTSKITGDTVLCYMQDSIYPYSVTGLPGSKYKWQVTGGTVMSIPDTLDNISIRWDSSGTSNITVVETSKDSCVGATKSLSVTINVTPTAKIINGNFYLCEENTGLNYVIYGLTGSTYLWTYEGGFNVQDDSTNTLIIDWDTAGVFDLSVVEISNKGCVGDTLDSIIVVNDIPETSGIIGDTAICFVPGDQYTYTVNGFLQSFFDWNVVGGTIMSGVDTSNSISVRWDSLGIGEVSVLEISEDTCTGDTIKKTISVNEVPSANKINGNFYLCEQNSGMIYTLNGLLGSTYFWSLPGASDVVNDSSNTVIANWDSAGSFLISVVEVSSAYCKGDTVDSIAVINQRPITSLINGDTIICPPGHLNVPYSVIGFDSSVFTWTISGGTIISGQGSDSIVVDWDTLSGNASLIVSEVTKDTCSSYTVTQNILIDYPLLSLLVVSTRESNDNEIEVEWDFNNETIYPDSLLIYKRILYSGNGFDSLTKVYSKSYTYTDPVVATETYAYEYDLKGNNACNNLVKDKVHNTILLIGSTDEEKETIKISWNAYSAWLQGVERYEILRKIDNKTNYFVDQSINDTVVSYVNGAEGFEHCFRIKAYEKGGAGKISFSNELCLYFKHTIKIPNVITPNQDGTNDAWVIHNIELYSDSRIFIFNRWGVKVFETTNYKNDWKGTKNGHPLPQGTYYYIIQINNNADSYKGFIRILR